VHGVTFAMLFTTFEYYLELCGRVVQVAEQLLPDVRKRQVHIIARRPDVRHHRTVSEIEAVILFFDDDLIFHFVLPEMEKILSKFYANKHFDISYSIRMILGTKDRGALSEA
jgi:hypothetical protein